MKPTIKVLIEGHRYELPNFEDQSKPGQVIQFIEKRALTGTAGEVETVNDGTTNEDLIEVLVDRLQKMGAKFPCRENSIAITHLESALLWLEKRTRDRKARGVEGKHLA